MKITLIIDIFLIPDINRSETNISPLEMIIVTFHIDNFIILRIYPFLDTMWAFLYCFRIKSKQSRNTNYEITENKITR